MAELGRGENPADISWQKVKGIFAAALNLKPEERTEYIDRQCLGDKKIADEVESLLSSYDNAALFLESPAVGIAADETLEDSPKLAPDKFLKHYKIVRKIGAGGMGAVYLARDKRLDRNVAIKVLNRPFDPDKSNLRRFLREAKTASGLNHPHIMVVHEVGTFEDINYIVCEFIEGETLNLYVEKNKSTLIDILDLCIQSLNALEAAHKFGIVHRDIKPENIMVRNDGIIKILDFGLAKAAQRSKTKIDFDARTQDIVSTQKGLILGTVAYMSPEQSRGKEIDERTDIWSLGVILFQMLTGKLPFSGETTSDTLVAILKDEPPPFSKFVSDIPAELERITRKCLQKNLDQRYQTAREVLNDLKDFRHNLRLRPSNESLRHQIGKNSDRQAKTDYKLTVATGGQPENFFGSFRSFISKKFSKSENYSNSSLFVLIVAAIMIIIGYIGFLYLNPVSNPSGSLPNIQFTKLTDERLAVPQTAISPDGKLIAYIFQKKGKQSLRIRQVAGSGVSEILAPDDVKFTGTIFSPDGDYIYYTIVKPDNITAVYRISVLGGQSRLIAERVDSQTARISPNGNSIAYIQEGTSIILADIDKDIQRVAAKASSGEVWYSLAWHPDGESITGAVRSQTEDTFYLINISLNNSSKTKIKSPPWKYIHKLAWLADGSGIIINGTIQQSQPLQIWSLSYPDGNIRRITNDTNDYFGLSLTADNKSLITGKLERAMNLWVSGDKYKKPGQQITFNKGTNDGALGVSWTPDDKIIYTVGSSGRSNIWSVNIDGSDNRQLTYDPAVHPKVSPDGRYIVFISDRGGNRNIRRMNIDGTRPVKLTDTPEQESFPNLTPDGKWIFYQRADLNNKISIWKTDLSGDNITRLTDDYAKEPVVSPNGKFFVCVHNTGGKNATHKMAVYSIDGGEPLKILDLPLVVNSNLFRWSADGKALIYLDDRDGADNLWKQPLDGKPPEQLTAFNSGNIAYFDVSKKEKKFLISRGEQFFDAVRISNFR